MPAIAFDRFYRYGDLTAILRAFATEHPDLVSIESLGKSHESRDIWVLTVEDIDGDGRILPEGRMGGWDGFMLHVKKNKHGLDMNRNLPANWSREFEQLGAGPYPTSEPEVRAVVAFIAGTVRATVMLG